MRVIRDTETIRAQLAGCGKTAVALGAFDGLHIGHRAVVRAAAESGRTPVGLTFWGNPPPPHRGRGPTAGAAAT